MCSFYLNKNIPSKKKKSCFPMEESVGTDNLGRAPRLLAASIGLQVPDPRFGRSEPSFDTVQEIQSRTGARVNVDSGRMMVICSGAGAQVSSRLVGLPGLSMPGNCT